MEQIYNEAVTGPKLIAAYNYSNGALKAKRKYKIASIK